MAGGCWTFRLWHYMWNRWTNSVVGKILISHFMGWSTSNISLRCAITYVGYMYCAIWQTTLHLTNCTARQMFLMTLHLHFIAITLLILIFCLDWKRSDSLICGWNISTNYLHRRQQIVIKALCCLLRYRSGFQDLMWRWLALYFFFWIQIENRNSSNMEQGAKRGKIYSTQSIYCK